MRRLFPAIACLFVLCGAATAADAPLWLRYPAISPDGSTIAFTYGGDLYRVDRSGGRAYPLTVYDGADTRPVWSPDGEWIAFASDRFGNFDVYVMPSQGGVATRLTFHSANDLPSGFNPDGKEILFTSARLDAASNVQFPTGSLPELYAVGVDGGRPRQISTIPAEEARYDRRGRRIIYQDRKGYENSWRKHHRSSAARDIWTLDTKSGNYTKLTDFEGEDRSPVFSADGKEFFYLSEAGGTFNVFQAAVDGSGEPQQLTELGPHPVRFLSRSGDGTLCFSYHGEIYTLDAGGKPSKVSIEIRSDAQNRPEDVLTVSGGIRQMSLSPSGKEIAFIYRGEVFATSIETDVTKRITNTPEQERSVDFSPDGRSLVYAAERGGSWNLYITSLAREEEDYFFHATILDEEPLLVSEAETFQPQFSPDGEEVAYLEDRTALKVINLESRESRTILPASSNFSYADGDQHFDWSPDGKWLLAEFLQPNYWISEVGLISSDGSGEVVNLTESGYFDSGPVWMMDGKMMIWVSNRDGLQAHAKTGPAEGDIYAMFFTREGFDRFRLTKEEAELLKEKEEKEEKEKKKAKKKDEEDSDGEGEEDDEGEGDEGDDAELPEVKIELDGLQDRKLRLTIHSSRLADAVVTPDGEKLFYLARFEKEYDLWVSELRTKETKILVKGAGAGSLALDEKGKNLYLLSGGKLSKIEIKSSKKKAIPVNGEMRLDAAAERAYMFEHAWRQVREKFYDPDLHGADWDFLRKEYAAFLPHITNNHDFAEMLSEILGELNASHTGARYRPAGGNGASTASLGLFYDEAHAGNGLMILEVMENNPILKDGSRIAAGVILEKIDGEPIVRGENYYPLLDRRAGKYVLLSLFDADTGERWEETVKPLTPGQESQLRYRRWVETRRQATEDLSGGRVGYVHVRGMNDSSYRVVMEEVFGRNANKEAIVIDTRFNGGGDLVDDLSIFLSGVQYMDFVPSDGRSIGMEPSRRWTKPSIVLAVEGNYSDAHCFPWAYQHLEIGKVVGMPVPGTCTFVWWERLQDRSLVFGIPNMAVTDRWGTPLENLQLQPDILVENEPGVVSAGRDQQLERAIEELLQELAN